MCEVTSQLYGLDLSRGMLKQAQRKGRQLYLIQGRAGQLPFPPATFDLIYCVNALHHFEAQRDFVFEARRLLRFGGALAVVGMDPRGRQDRYYIYRYFEGTYRTDLERFPSWGTVLDWMALAGFERVSWRLVERILDDKVGATVLADPFLEKDATSQLALLPDEVYAQGLQRIRAALRKAETAEQSLVFPVDIPVGMVVGTI
jgi:SAM-dependent methyltransferase